MKPLEHKCARLHEILTDGEIIRADFTHKWRISAQIFGGRDDGKLAASFNNFFRFRIYYCPFCGERLQED